MPKAKRVSIGDYVKTTARPKRESSAKGGIVLSTKGKWRNYKIATVLTEKGDKRNFLLKNLEYVKKAPKKAYQKHL